MSEAITGFPAGFAPRPVSTQAISAHALVRSYREEWVGDDSDVELPDRAHGFVGVDMTAWTTAFLEVVDTLFAPEMAAAIALLDPDRAASLAAHRQVLAELIASTLVPVLIVPGETPEIAPARALFREALLTGLGQAYAPAVGKGDPLRACPALPAISAERAVGAPAPGSIAEALAWSYVFTVATPQAAQDALLLSVALNDRPTPPAATMAEPPTPVAPRGEARNLFEALARARFELPQIVPHLAALSAGGDAAVARAALARIDAVIGDVVSTWPAWFAQPLAPAVPDAGPAPAMGAVVWRYAIDFGGLPVLGATRSCDGNGALPPWPAILGFTAPAEDAQPAGRYRPSGSDVVGTSLNFAWAGLPALRVQDAHVAARVKRNANLVPTGAPEGTLVDRAFLYLTPAVAGAASVAPAIDPSCQTFPVGVDAPDLSAAMDDVFAQLLAGPTIGGIAIRDVEIAVEACWRMALGDEGTAAESDIPILQVRTCLALSAVAPEGAVLVAAFRAALLDALRGWHAAVRPDEGGAKIGLAIALSAVGAQSAPLVRLGRVEIAVPMARPAWWG
ncbi:MAG: hypothetical protein JWM65_3770 [Sphingomonas bacterium]|nr:hypothetical protein [Sphingomonas bacterium]